MPITVIRVRRWTEQLAYLDNLTYSLPYLTFKLFLCVEPCYHGEIAHYFTIIMRHGSRLLPDPSIATAMMKKFSRPQTGLLTKNNIINVKCIPGN